MLWMNQSELFKDQRLPLLQQWVDEVTGSAAVLQPASADASFRRYFRLQQTDRTLIVMDAPPEQELLAPFIDIAHRLQAAGVQVPVIHAEDCARGFLLLSDLGERTYLQWLQQDAPSESLIEQRYQQAIAALLRMQHYTSTAGLPVYNEALLRREMDLFPQWYLGHHHGLTLSPSLTAAWDALQAQLLEAILPQSRVFVHRDFMPRNLMIGDPDPGVIDFQDAVAGPVSYDPICLFKDAFISWPQARVQDWLELYWQQARQRGLPVPDSFDQFLFDCDVMGVQRHLKVIGIFSRIRYRDGKSHYFGDLPRFFAYLQEVAERQSRLPALPVFLQALQQAGVLAP